MATRETQLPSGPSRTWAPLTLLIVPTMAILGMWGLGPTDSELSQRQAPADAPSVSPVSKPLEERPAPTEPTSAPRPSAEDSVKQLEALVERDPHQALERIAAERGGEPPERNADQLDWLEMRALVHLRRIGRARDAAVAFYTNHPDSPLVEKVHALTGRHLPPRMGPTAPLTR